MRNRGYVRVRNYIEVGGISMTLSVNLKDNRAQKVIENAKIKALKSKVSVSEVVISLLEQWSKGEIVMKEDTK